MNKNSAYVESLVFETASAELGIPLEVVQKVFLQGQVEFTSRKIAEGGLETVMWPYLGKFRPKMKKVYSIQEGLARQKIKLATKKPK